MNYLSKGEGTSETFEGAGPDVKDPRREIDQKRTQIKRKPACVTVSDAWREANPSWALF